MGHKWKLLKASSIIGALLINFFSRPFLYWGNMSVYVQSYLVNQGHTVVGAQNSWFFTFYNVSWSAAMFFSERMTSYVQTRYIVLVGMIVFNCFFLGSVFSGAVSWISYLAIFGTVSGLGLGTFEGLVIKHYVVDWSTNDQGFLTSLCVSSAATGAAILNQFMTFWVNPRNLPPDLEIGTSILFSQEEILSNVSTMFLISGVINLALQFIGFCLIRDSSIPECSITSHTEYQTISVGNGETPGVHELQLQNQQENRQDNVNNLNDQERDSEDTLVNFLFIRNFQKLWCIIFFLNHSMSVITLNYKNYGLTQIKNDHFLTTLGTTMSLSGIFSTVIWGIVLDKLGVGPSLIIITSSVTIAGLAMYFTAMLNQWAYFVSTVIAYDIADSAYVFMIVASLVLFGKKHRSRNIALLNIATSLSSFTVSEMIEVLLDNLGWFSVFAASSSMSGFALFVALTFRDL